MALLSKLLNVTDMGIWHQQGEHNFIIIMTIIGDYGFDNKWCGCMYCMYTLALSAQ